MTRSAAEPVNPTTVDDRLELRRGLLVVLRSRAKRPWMTGRYDEEIGRLEAGETCTVSGWLLRLLGAPIPWSETSHLWDVRPDGSYRDRGPA